MSDCNAPRLLPLTEVGVPLQASYLNRIPKTSKFHRKLACAGLLFFLISTLSLPVPANEIAGSEAGTTADKTAITRVLSDYFAALNASRTGAILRFYSEDGAFFPLFQPTAVGKAAIRRSYDEVFEKSKVDIKFHIAQIVQMAPDWAFARVNSDGTLTFKAKGTQLKDAAQELFIFKKDSNGTWKIAQYCFSPTVAQTPP